MLTLLALVAATLVFAGCGGAGSSGSSQTSEEEGRRASQTAGPESAEDVGDERASQERLGHPALGSAEAPVVLTEYADYQ